MLAFAVTGCRPEHLRSNYNTRNGDLGAPDTEGHVRPNILKALKDETDE